MPDSNTNYDLQTLDGFRNALAALMAAIPSGGSIVIPEAVQQAIDKVNDLTAVLDAGSGQIYDPIKNISSKNGGTTVDTNTYTSIPFPHGDTNFMVLRTNFTSGANPGGGDGVLELYRMPYGAVSAGSIMTISSNGLINLPMSGAGLVINGRNIYDDVNSVSNGMMTPALFSKLHGIDANATNNVLIGYDDPNPTGYTDNKIGVNRNSLKAKINTLLTNDFYDAANPGKGIKFSTSNDSFNFGRLSNELFIAYKLGNNAATNYISIYYDTLHSPNGGVVSVTSNVKELNLNASSTIISSNSINIGSCININNSRLTLNNLNEITGVDEYNQPFNKVWTFQNYGISNILHGANGVVITSYGFATVTREISNIYRIDFNFSIATNNLNPDAQHDSYEYGIDPVFFAEASSVADPCPLLTPKDGGNLIIYHEGSLASFITRGLSFMHLENETYNFWLPIKAMESSSDMDGVSASTPSAYLDRLIGFVNGAELRPGDILVGTCYGEVSA